VELSGPWLATALDDAGRRTFAEPDLDTSDWSTIDVPGHWRSNEAFETSDGPLAYRRSFPALPTDANWGDDARRWLVFDGLFYQGDMWLDGSYLGDTEGFHLPHSFDITSRVSDPESGEHVVAVEVACAPQTDPTAKRNLTGIFQHWDCLDPDWNPGGIWRGVRIDTTGPARIERLRVLCTEARAERATLECRATVDAAVAGTVRITMTVRNADGLVIDEHQLDHTASTGPNRVRWTSNISNPPLWWPHALGDQNLVTVDVAVQYLTDAELDARGASDRRVLTTGLRHVAMRNWIFTVNGERLFLKGTNIGPTRMQLAEATAEELERDVVLAKQAGLDLLRVHAHITRPELYEAADRHGMLIWQDMPLQWGYARSVLREATRQARETVDLLGHHPSIALWCGHNEPLTFDIRPDTDSNDSTRLALSFLVGQQFPTFNKTVLDRSIKRTLDKADPSRPVISHSGMLPGAGSRNTDTHLYYGWYQGSERDLPRAASTWPALVRFVSEFGAQAVPNSADFCEPKLWPDLDWPALQKHHALQLAFFDKHVPPAEYETFDLWRDATQAYQAMLLRHHVETLRRLKYRPAGGFCQFLFADGFPGITWSVLDHERVPKRGYEALAAACAPVIVVADRPDAQYEPGDALALDVHVVSDRRVPLLNAKVTADLRWFGGNETWTWGGDMPADSCVRVGTVQAIVPDAAGPLTLELKLTFDTDSETDTDTDSDTGAGTGTSSGSQVEITNRYVAAIS
jgi:beta-mannosidase